VTPDAKRSPPAKRTAADRTKTLEIKLFQVIEDFMDEHPDSFDSAAIDHIVKKLKREDVTDDEVDTLMERVTWEMAARNHQAEAMKKRVDELAEQVELTPTQRELLLKLENERLKQAAFDQFKGFLELASVYADYRNHISTKIHPEYKQQELLREALASLQEREVEDDFGHRPQFKVARMFQFPRDDDPENTGAAAAAGASSSSAGKGKGGDTASQFT
jgi:DNA-binding MarR family transcriptional regulator